VSEALSREDVEHVAALARLDLTEDELNRFTRELASIIEHVEELAGLDLRSVEPTAHPLPLVNVVRDDTVRPCLDRAEVLAAAPAVEDHRFRVPRILDAT
jgi:aspartyl-tRNA(Asn)/glutamyl-tRNA(Gln) amidotransferase subunit C